MIEGLLLPHWAVPVEEPIYKVSGAPLDEPHNITDAHAPSLYIPPTGEYQGRVSVHHYPHVQVDGHVLGQPDGGRELADRRERFVALDRAARGVEALLTERAGIVASRDRAEQMIAFA